jgi:hypothetical protein
MLLRSTISISEFDDLAAKLRTHSRLMLGSNLGREPNISTEVFRNFGLDYR